MSLEPLLLVRADAGGLLGTGHVMRMLALAQAWQDRGGKVLWAYARCPAPLAQRLAQECVEVHEWTTCEPGDDDDAKWTRALASRYGVQVLVLDNYHFSSAYQQQVRDEAWTLVCVDDYGHCELWHADVILNQNPPARRPDVSQLSGGDRVRLLWGEHFALLRREFRLAALKPVPEATQGHLLITFGGVDPLGATQRVLDSLERGDFSSWHIRVIVGPGNVFFDELRQRVSASRYRMELLVAVTNMVEQFTWADRVISAAGSSCYEWMSLRKCAWVGVIAMNQREVALYLQQHGLATVWPCENWDDAAELDASLHAWLATAPIVPQGNFSAEGAARVVGALWSPRVEMAAVSFSERLELAADTGLWKLWGHVQSDGTSKHLEGIVVKLRDSAESDFAIAQLTSYTGADTSHAELNVWFKADTPTHSIVDAAAAVGQVLRSWSREMNVTDWLVFLPKEAEARAQGLAVLSPLGFVFSVRSDQTVLGHCSLKDLLPI